MRHNARNTMNLYQLLKHNENYRERKNKNRCIAEYVFGKYLIDGEVRFRAGVAKDLVKKINSADREWRKILKENPHLRGSDYKEGTKLSQQKQIELGYEVGYHQDIKLKDKI